MVTTWLTPLKKFFHPCIKLCSCFTFMSMIQWLVPLLFPERVNHSDANNARFPCRTLTSKNGSMNLL